MRHDIQYRAGILGSLICSTGALHTAYSGRKLVNKQFIFLYSDKVVFPLVAGRGCQWGECLQLIVHRL